MEKKYSSFLGLLGTMEIKRYHKIVMVSFLLFFTIIDIFSQDLSGMYLYNLNHRWKFETISLQKVNDRYLFIYDAPTYDGIDAYSAYQLGSWDGEQIIFDNGYNIYGLKPLPNGTLHYYLIEGEGEFPGKDFRPITEEDLKKIVEMN
jgi:hypothetical protein